MMIGQRRRPGIDPLAALPEPAPVMESLPAFGGAGGEMPLLPASSGGGSRAWAGILADGLLGLAGRQGVYAPMMEQRRQEQTALERGEQQYRRQRADSNTDWERNKAWELANRTPQSWEDNAGNRWERRNGENVRVFTDTAPKQYIQDGMLVTVPNPYNVGAAPAVPPPPPTIDESIWNTGKPIGGPLVSPAGRFR